MAALGPRNRPAACSRRLPTIVLLIISFILVGGTFSNPRNGRSPLTSHHQRNARSPRPAKHGSTKGARSRRIRDTWEALLDSFMRNSAGLSDETSTTVTVHANAQPQFQI